MCVCGTGKEDNEHFLLQTAYCAKISLTELSDIDGFNVADVDLEELCHLFLIGDRTLGTVANRMILEAIISFIKASARLN